MDKNTYYKELNLEYNIDKLLEEEKRVEYIQRWPDWQPNWSQGYVIDFSNFEEIGRLVDILKYRFKSNDVRPRFYKQQANTCIGMHKDRYTNPDRGPACSVNIILSKKSSPIVFEDVGNINYKCALLNLAKQHSIPSFEEERLLLKFSIFDVSYEDAFQRWEQQPLWHLDYEIDKEYWRNVFYENIQDGQWHWSVPKQKKLYWYQLFIDDNSPLKELTKDVEMDLGIYGMNNFPRFSYQFPNTLLGHHFDEDSMVSINLNLLETKPIIHIEHKSYPYEAIFVDVGHKKHGVELDPNNRLILKFCLRHPFEEVYNKLRNMGLINE